MGISSAYEVPLLSKVEVGLSFENSTDSATSRSLDFVLFLKILLRFRAFDLLSLYFYFLKTHYQEIFRK